MQERIIRADDPACADLQARGWVVVARSWGANLDPADPAVARRLQAAQATGRAAGVEIREVGRADAAQVAPVESANHADYPQTPATRHEPVTAQSFLAMLDHGSRAWAAVRGGEFIGVCVATAKPAGWWDITFASVLAGHRRKGIGQALAATIISDLTADGATRISTGGAASNHASRAAALALGARLEPEWRTYAPP